MSSAMASMRPYAAVVALSALAMPALTQTLSPPANTSPAATAAQQPVAGSPRTFLEAARLAITQGQLNDASVALEEAETRILTRSVQRSPTVEPSKQPLIATINDARNAVASSDKATALAKIDEAMKNPALDAPSQ